MDPNDFKSLLETEPMTPLPAQAADHPRSRGEMEVSELAAALLRARSDLSAANERIKKLLGLVRDLEWPVTYGGASYCGRCGAADFRGHRDDCPVREALKP